MTDVIQLNHQAENTYEFDLEIEGLTTVEIRAWFVIVVKGMELAFPCTQDKNHFVCKIPPLPFVERTTYRGVVRLVADDYFFEVASNLVVNVVGNLSFERSDMKHMTVKTTMDGKVYESKVKDSIGEVDAQTLDDSGKATVKTDVKRVENVSDIAKRIINDTTKNTPDVKEKTAAKKAPETPVKKNIDTKQFKTPAPEPQEKSNLPTGPKKITQPTKKELSTAEEKGKLAKKIVVDQPKKLAEDTNEKKFVRKGKKQSEDAVDKNALIEEEVSQFVNVERSEREEKLRAILQNFTVSPDTTPTKARFVRKNP